ncbi:MAG TPA: glycogen debranching N-terminal domain-containing protein [Galbitalea sp.]
MTELQPLLSDETVILLAPTQCWSDASGAMGARPIHGAYLSDTRILSSQSIRFDGREAEVIAARPHGSNRVDFEGVLRQFDGGTADPRVRSRETRTVTPTGLDETVTVSSGLAYGIRVEVRVELGSDLARMDDIKAGLAATPIAMRREARGATWGAEGVTVTLQSDARVEVAGDGLHLVWQLEVPPHGDVSTTWRITATDKDAVVGPATTAPDWRWPDATGDPALDRWMSRARDDLTALRMSTLERAGSAFIAAGAPWFFTLFGRDSLWTARFLVPLGGSLARDTLHVLADMQGTRVDAASAEEPGKIPHELRRSTQHLGPEAVTLPPLYYGTIDATPLWIALLCDTADAGMSESEVRGLLPTLEAALAWMRDYGDADGDGLLEYINSSHNGLSNQGWKDSGDSVQWRDGTLATAPIALCEVQGYAFEAATRGAALLERYGRDGAKWRDWAERLRTRFNTQFWVEDQGGAYPAIALDTDKRAVDSLTSNIGHLLGTGILDDEQSSLVAARLISSPLSSGFGLRTLSTDSAGYWPLSYHGGSVWTHDTAIAIRGLTLAGFADEARTLSEGLLSAAVAFDYRMPELHSGDPATAFSRPVPYPAACRPQAWSAAAAIVVHTAMTANADQ